MTMSQNGSSRAVRGLARVSAGDLTRELRRRENVAARLTRKRDALLARAADLDRHILACGGTVRRSALRGGPRGGRSTTLVDALAHLLKGKTLSVTEMAGAVQDAGYKTSSPNFRTIVNAALLANRGRFKRVSRGRYTAA